MLEWNAREQGICMCATVNVLAQGERESLTSFWSAPVQHHPQQVGSGEEPQRGKQQVDGQQGEERT